MTLFTGFFTLFCILNLHSRTLLNLHLSGSIEPIKQIAIWMTFSKFEINEECIVNLCSQCKGMRYRKEMTLDNVQVGMRVFNRIPPIIRSLSDSVIGWHKFPEQSVLSDNESNSNRWWIRVGR